MNNKKRNKKGEIWREGEDEERERERERGTQRHRDGEKQRRDRQRQRELLRNDRYMIRLESRKQGRVS